MPSIFSKNNYTNPNVPHAQLNPLRLLSRETKTHTAKSKKRAAVSTVFAVESVKKVVINTFFVTVFEGPFCRLKSENLKIRKRKNRKTGIQKDRGSPAQLNAGRRTQSAAKSLTTQHDVARCSTVRADTGCTAGIGSGTGFGGIFPVPKVFCLHGSIFSSSGSVLTSFWKRVAPGWHVL